MDLPSLSKPWFKEADGHKAYISESPALQTQLRNFSKMFAVTPEAKASGRVGAAVKGQPLLSGF